mgnify:CR=1 FL=1
MGIVSIVVLAVIVIAIIRAIMIYNNLVNLKHAVAKNWSNIDVLLKQRHDELPKLVEACKQYKQFEQDTLQRVTDARACTKPASGRTFRHSDRPRVRCAPDSAASTRPWKPTRN